MKDEHRAKLLELAARRREKGFSDLVAEAIESYLAGQMKAEETRQAALALRGSLSDGEAEELRQVSRELRESWR